MPFGPKVLLYELSTPFVNIHWWLDKVNRTGSTLQLVNGLVLTIVFFLCRNVWGTYVAYRFVTDLVRAYLDKPGSFPIWLGALFVANNMALNVLNW